VSDLHVLHWSDLHFAAGTSEPDRLTPARAVALATEAVRRDHGDQQFVLALSGDITTRGRSGGYREALTALDHVRRSLSLSAVVVCPGNHDIAPTDPRSFSEFNRFALSATGDAQQMWDGQQPVRTVRIGDYSILLVNSAYEGDHSFGSTPLRALRLALDAADGTHPIVVMHHSPISGAYAGGGMKDAYDLLALVSEYPVAALLHGHVHSDLGLRIGRHGTLLFGAGSLGFEPDENMNNQFVIHRFENGVAVESDLYRYFKNVDRFEKGTT
jgi:3',5'-cyclic AMP phosphodiesterase CpdA